VIVDVLGDAVEPYALVDLGRPYFSDFSPDGGRVIAHVADEVRVVDLDGEATPLAGAAIGHQTPSWHPTDEVVFFTRIEGASNEIVRHDLSSGVSESIAAFDGFVFFDLDPAGSTLAVASFGRTQGQGPEAVRGSPQRTLGQGLWIVEADGGEPVPIDDQPASAPMWDPTGSRFLVRTSIGGAGRWSTYERDGTSSGTEDFDIDETLMPAYLPFWDQYVRSQTLWSPDGSRFVHAGRPEDGTSGIWIHDATESGPSIRLADGDLAFWSPT
jgi:Tol biopolymer transport system component